MKRLYALVLSGVVGLVVWNGNAQSPFGVMPRVERGDGPRTLRVAFAIPTNHVLYAEKLAFKFGTNETPVAFTLPEPVVILDKFSKKEKPVFQQSFEAAYLLDETVAGQNLTVHFQGCDNANCYFPEDRSFSIAASGVVARLDDVDEEETTDVAAATEWRQAVAGLTVANRGSGYMSEKEFLGFLEKSKSGEAISEGMTVRTGFWGVLLTMGLILVGGVALNLTPCILPMIPINLAIIGAGAQAGSKKRGFALGATYAAGMAIAYGVLGLVVVLTGSKFGTLNSSPWFNLGIASVFLFLALAMFGMVNVDLSRFQGGGSAGGPSGSKSKFIVAYTMGTVAALLAGACVAPVVISVLLQATTLHAKGVTVGLLLPFLLGLGMGLPWPFAGAGLSFLPKPGKWMVRVKYGFGVMIVLFAAYYGHLAFGLFRSGVELTAQARGGESQAANSGKFAAELVQALHASKADGRPVFVDFYASWCKNCSAMEHTTFAAAAVKDRLAEFHEVRLPAEHPNESPVKELLDHFQVMGLPSFIVLRPDRPPPHRRNQFCPRKSNFVSRTSPFVKGSRTMNVRRIASIGLAVVLQVLPLTRVFVAATPAMGSSYAIIATWIAGLATLMGGVDAVSGASTTITSAKTATATNGVAFSYRITTGPDVANTFAATPLPTGLVVSGTSGRITGTPTVTGVHVIHLTASDNGQANRTVTADLTLTILAGGGGGAIAPSITTQPASQTVSAGANVNFTVAASGTAPLRYQWRLNGANVANATNTTLALTSVTTGQSGGGYSCVVSNAAGGATSSTATLTVNPAVIAPAITTSPASQTVTAGANVSFTVAASGTAPLGYQWRLNGANLAGATSATLILTSVTTSQSGGSYSCVVSNSAGIATSAAAALTVNPVPVAPTITTHPASQTVTAGANVNFTIAASGTAPLGYQWRLNGANLAGATSATLTLNSVTTGQSGGSYSCVVSNSAGTATSSAATLTVNPALIAPTITPQPANQSVTAGANASFSVAASGTAPLSYQWRLNGVNLAGATTATLSLTSVTVGQSGGSYSCVVSNIAGTATSSAAVLTVTAAAVAPTISTQPVNQTVTAGANATFSVVASGTAPLSYQWRLNGANLAGATSATLTLTGVTTNQSGGSYSCFVTNVAGSATSSAATLTVNAAPIAPSITTQPVSQTVTEGANVSFSVMASGTAPLSYQWRLNGANLAGAASATLTLTGVATNSSGSYSCLVSNVAGMATSSAAGLTVNPLPVAPTITTQPVSQTATAGNNVTFVVAASGTAPLSFQWRRNGANLAGATSATLALTGVTTNQAGSYSCFVSNIAGSATSATATLTVNPAPIAPTITLQPVSQTVMAGTNVSFTVAASGTAPLNFQWRLNGANLPGATSATLTLAGVTTGQSGNYSCVVTNAGGSATSAGAVLTVNAAAAQPSKLIVTITGQGQVLPNLNGASLTIGKVYTLSVYPAAGYVFSGWERDAQPLSSSTMISFVMTSNLVLAANFTADPLVAAAGTYNGLFYEGSDVQLNSAGAFNVGLAASGSFSAWVQIGYSRYQFSGTVDANFQATSTVPRWNGPPLTVQLTIGQGALAGQIYGSVSDGVWTAPLSGGRSPTSSQYAGEYTVAIPGVTGNASLPAGDGYALLHVAADGLGTMSGTLADGSTFAHSAYVTPDGDWPLYISLYVGKGAIVSWLTFTNLSSSDVSGDLVWIKQAGASATSYPLGFTNGLKAVGSTYLAPDAVGKAVNLAGAVVDFNGGSLAASFNNLVSVNAGSQVVNLSPNLMTFSINPANGSFAGQVSEPGNGVTHKFGGVVLQKQNAGFGTMVGTPNGSRVVLVAP